MVYVSVPFVLRAFCTYREGCPLHRLRKTYYLLHLNERTHVTEYPDYNSDAVLILG